MHIKLLHYGMCVCVCGSSSKDIIKKWLREFTLKNKKKEKNKKENKKKYKIICCGKYPHVFRYFFFFANEILYKFKKNHIMKK